jgi:glucose/arabinose dehydrogenase
LFAQILLSGTKQMQNLVSSTGLLDPGLSNVRNRSDFDLTSDRVDLSTGRSTSKSSSLVIIDSTVQNYQNLAAGAFSGDIVLLDATRDGLTQISEVLADRHDLTSLHIVSHGSAGTLQLGNAAINLTSLNTHSSELQHWATALTANADILLYGCDVAAGEAGEAFIQQLSQLTGADIAASSDRTGNATLGGNWVLEKHTGAIEAGLAFSNSVLQSYDAILPTLNFSDFSTTTGLQLNGKAAQVGTALRLTPAQTMQAGSAFLATPFDFDTNTSFQSRFRFNLAGGYDAVGGDGFTFMLQNSAAGASALGGTGGSLGYSPDDNPATVAINRSVAIEFDTYQNPTDPNGNHVAILQNGNAAVHLALANPTFDLNGGNPINAWVDYDAVTDQLDVFLSEGAIKPTAALLSYKIDLAGVIGSSAFVGFSAGTGGTINYQEIQNWEFDTTVVDPGDGSGAPGRGNGILGEYFNNRDFTDLKFSRLDPNVDFEWGRGTPDALIDADTFSVRWTGQLQARSTGTYTFASTSDDGMRVSINGAAIIDNLVPTGPAGAEFTGTIDLVSGQRYDLQVEYINVTGRAFSRLTWEGPGVEKQVIARAQLLSDPGAPPPPPLPLPTGTIVIGENAVTVNENAGTATVRVDRVGGSFGAASVNYTTVDETALPGLDYTTTAGFLQFADGQTSATVTIPIINDTIAEDTKRFGFGLGQTTGAKLGTNRTALITVLDDDAPANLGFSVGQYNVNENDGTVAITVQRSGNLDNNASVQYATSNGTATAGTDYTAQTGTLNFLPGETRKTFRIAITDDAVGEPNETINLTLSNPTGGILDNQNTATITIADNDPGKFVRESIATGLYEPTSFDWSPDGRTMYIAQKQGLVRVMRDGVLQANPFIDISDEVNGPRDRGLLGIAVHPQLTQGSPYIYLLYSYDPPETATRSGLAGRDGVGNRASRMIRVTADARTNYTTVVPGSEVVILGKNSTWQNISRPDLNSTNNFNIPESGRNADGSFVQDFLALDSESHAVGSVKFGTDGYLYVSVGDGTSYNAVDPRAVRVLNVNSLSGKVLRIDPITGQGIANNPFFNGNLDSNASKVWQLGLRNPFRFTINKDNGQVYVGDVGWTKWEEINTGDGGENFGWVGYEGGNPQTGESFRTGGYSNLQTVKDFYNSGATVTAPIYTIQHSGGGGDAIAVGDFYTGNTFPTIYNDSLFITNVSKGYVDTLYFDATGKVSNVQRFANNVYGIVQMTTGPDSNLYYAMLDGQNGGEIGRWRPA